MKADVARQLVELNHAFYERFATEFADSRSALQPGIVRALKELRPFHALLDLGCGDGRVGTALNDGLLGAWNGRYVGVDNSRALLQQRAQDPRSMRLIEADLTECDWWRSASLPPASFDAAVCLSLLHHIPTVSARRAVLKDLAQLLAEGASCAISVWQFLHRERFQRKRVPWSEIGLDPSDVDEGDVLLDWQRGGRGLRYVHHFGLDELQMLCQEAGLTATDHFRSDGDTDDLGLYLIAVRRS